MAEYVLPSLGADMEHATLVEWHVAPNDVVTKGQVVGMVETEKAVMDIEFFQDGVIEEVLVPVGEKVAVGTPLLRFRPLAAAAPGPTVPEARIRPPATVAPALAVAETRIEPPVPAAAVMTAAASAAPTRATPEVVLQAPPTVPAPPVVPAPPIVPAGPTVPARPTQPSGAPPATVAEGRVAPPSPGLGHRIHLPVKRLAAELGVDLARVAGTGPGGQVMKHDVRAAAAQMAGAPQPSAAAVSGARPISPRARRLAEEYDVDLLLVAPTGPQGSVSAEDVERAVRARDEAARARDEAARARPAAGPAPGPASAPTGELMAGTGSAPAPSPALVEIARPAAGPAPTTAPTQDQRAAERQLAMRGAIAALMARSKREIPHYYLTLEIDLHRAMTWLEQENLARPTEQRLLPAALLIKATALSLRDVREMNGFWVDDRFVPGSGIHVGVAISLRGGGLMAPAIHDADQKSLTELMASLRDLVARTRSGSLHRAEMADPTITVTNLGDLGVDSVLGVIYPPQVALVGFGRIRERPVAIEGLVGARPAITATLAADHRNSDGHRGGVFLAAIDRRLQEPERL